MPWKTDPLSAKISMNARFKSKVSVLEGSPSKFVLIKKVASPVRAELDIQEGFKTKNLFFTDWSNIFEILKQVNLI